MVLIDVEVTVDMYAKVDGPMLGYLFEHVVEEAEPCGDVALACAVEAERDVDVGLFGGASHTGCALASEEELGYLIPRLDVVAEDEIFASEVEGELLVCLTVADDIAVGEVVFTCHVTSEHGCARLACGQVVGGEGAVDENVIEGDAFASESVEHEVVCRPEGVLGI